MIVGVMFCVLATMDTPPDEPDNVFVPTANFFAGILATYIGVASVVNRGYRKYWALTLTLFVIFLSFFLLWIIAMGVWYSHPRASKGIVIITPYIITIPFAAFTYVSTLQDTSEISLPRKKSEGGNDEEMEPMPVTH